MEPVVALRMALSMLAYVVPYSMLATKVEAREGIVWRRAVAGLVVLAFALLMAWEGAFSRLGSDSSDVITNAMFVGILAVATALFRFCGRCTTWTALFCALFGYSMQNLGSSLLNCAVLACRVVMGMPDEAVLSILLVLTAAAAYALCRARFLAKIPRGALAAMGSRPTYVLVIFIVFINIIADSIVKGLPETGIGWATCMELTVAQAISCLFVLHFEFESLLNARLIRQVSASERAFEERERQYRMSRETVKAINARMHDIRHALADSLADEVESGELSRQSLAAAIREVETYDLSVSTGHSALDTALTERRMLCAHDGITLTCMADGACLHGVKPADTYALMSGLLEKAMAEARGCDRRARSISVSVRATGGMAHVHVENDCIGAGLPVPSEVTAIVEHYGGVITHGTSGGTAYVNVLLPIG